MAKKELTFNKNEKGEWYLQLPEWTGDPAELQMVEGADQWLELVGKGNPKINLTLSTKNFDQAAVLTLLRTKEQNLGGGGIYYLESYLGATIELKIWLCEVTRFIFDDLPQKIYFLKK